MSAPTPDKATPSSAELRACTACFYEGFGTLNPDKSLTLTIGPINREGIVRCLLAGADAMDSLAAVSAQRDRLAEALRRVKQSAHLAEFVEDRPGYSDTESWRCLGGIARAALAELEGGAS